MSIIKKIAGKIIYAIAKVLYIILDSLIQLIEKIISFVKGITKGCFVLISMGGCLLFLLFAGTLMRILADPKALFALVVFLAFPILGTIFVAYLKYLKFIATEYLFNLANYLMDGTKYQYNPFSQYKVAYRKAQEERIREEQRRYYGQQRQWGERFNQQWHQQHSQGGQGSYSRQGNYGHTFVNPAMDFKKKYEKSCDVLGVPYDADKNQIKLAYRRKAKESHPDLSKAPDAVKMFQEINDANEFLSDDHIQRYKTL